MMFLKPGDVVLIEARVVEDFGNDAQVQFDAGNGHHQMCLAKSGFKHHDPRTDDFLIAERPSLGGRIRTVIVAKADRMARHA